MKVRRQRALLVIGSAILAVIVTEAALRAASSWLFPEVVIRPDPVLGWSLRPGLRMFSRDENAIWVEHNSAGWHDRERAIDAAPGTLRVAVIGDSFIHGYFAPLEETFGAFLESSLTNCSPKPHRFEVLSFGVFGYNTTQELLTYRDHASRYRPDIVLLAFYTANDIFDNHPKLSSEFAPRYVYEGDTLVLDQSFQRVLPTPSRQPWRRQIFELLLTHSRVFRLVKESVEKARDFIHTPPPDPSPEVDEPDTSIYKSPIDPTLAEAWRNTEGVLLKFRDEVRATGSEFWLATLYNLPQVDPDLSHRRTLEASLGVDSLFYPDHRLAAFARDHQIPVISLAEPLADYTAANHVYISGGNSANAPLGTGHWNKTGASEAAKIAASQICRESSVLR